MLNIPLALGRPGGPPLLERRQETLAIGPEARRRTRYSLAGRELIDTLDAVRRHDFVMRDMPGYNLKDAARYFEGMETDARGRGREREIRQLQVRLRAEVDRE